MQYSITTESKLHLTEQGLSGHGYGISSYHESTKATTLSLAVVKQISWILVSLISESNACLEALYFNTNSHNEIQAIKLVHFAV